MGTDGYAHKGIYLAATNLDRLLYRDIFSLLSKYDGYRLVICGHSYGAGVAALLAALWLTRDEILLKQKRLHVFGFGTPAVLSPEIATKLAEYMVTVIMGNDMIPRLSLDSFQRFQDCIINRFNEEKDDVLDTLSSKIVKRSTEAVVPETLIPAGVLVWIDDSSSNQHKTKAIVSVDGLLLKNHFRNISISKDMFLAHLPQNYGTLGSIPLPKSFI